MEKKVVLVDTSVLIELFRKKHKEKSFLYALARDGYEFFFSAVTEFEIFTWVTDDQRYFWEKLLKNNKALPFDSKLARIAAEINLKLKRKRKLIDTADLFIAATAVGHGLPVATFNIKHFERVDELVLIKASN